MLRKPPKSLGAWEAYQRGLWHFNKYAAAENQIALGFFRQAIALSRTHDPDFHALDRAQWDGADDVLDLLEAWIGAHAAELP